MQNAGVAFAPQPPNDLTKDGSFEAVYAGNYLGHFLLTELLLPTIKATPGARVSFTSSITHWGATFDLDDLLPDGDLARGRRKDDNVYQNSKLLQILHCFELQRRLRGTGVTLTPVAPGLIQTDIFDNDDKRKGGDFKTDVSWPMQSIEEGCKTNLHALLSPSMEGQEGYFLQPCTRPPLALEPRRPQTSFASTHSPRPSPDALASPMASPRPAFERTHASASLPPHVEQTTHPSTRTRRILAGWNSSFSSRRFSSGARGASTAGCRTPTPTARPSPPSCTTAARPPSPSICERRGSLPADAQGPAAALSVDTRLCFLWALFGGVAV